MKNIFNISEKVINTLSNDEHLTISINAMKTVNSLEELIMQR